ncbi:MAG: protein-(glutamine-N5) methyltransferase, release factor-specific [Gemmatimonadetes bacterium]|nr:protein-(glutamine-N5) methyltransferase, release factor-specific [Gemmatimonadota bacterium]
MSSVVAVVQEMADVLRATLGDEAIAEARELLALIHDQPRHWPVVAGSQPISAADSTAALLAAQRRASGAPIQYAAGRAAFRHLTLHVDERVLIPRPETEQLVEIVLERTNTERGGIAVDVGTGSGAIALALATEGRFEHVIATDVSLDALAVARKNAERYADRRCARFELRHGSLLGPVHERGLRAIVSNPPYISFEEAAALPASVRDWEPSVALFSASDGLATTEQLIREAAGALEARGLLALEVDMRRAHAVADFMRTLGAYDDVQVLPDLTGRDRFVVARKRGEEK